MKATRREFMRAVGVMVASLLTTRCRPMVTCYTPATTPPSNGGGDDLWDDLRAPWEELDLLAQDARDGERGQETLERLTSDHRAALDRLVEAGELDPEVADALQEAFEGAAYHVWRANAPITCYIPSPYPDYRVQSSSDLARQAEVLAEMAEESDIDPDTLAQAQAAIERDIAFLSLPSDEQQAIVKAVVEAAGEEGPYPRFSELDLDIPPEATEAARILVDLLLER